MFGNERAKESFKPVYRAAQDALDQRTDGREFEVAPQAALDVVRDGKMIKLGAGEEVLLADLAHPDIDTNPRAHGERLVRRGILLQRDNWDYLRAL